MKKKIYFAPLEGVTGYVYRNAHRKYFGNIDKYFMPFVVTNQTGKLKSKERNDILPEHNEGITGIPQILGNNAEQLVLMAEFLQQLGYEEINLNLGCPARTVVTKKKGSGFLAYPEELDRFLDVVYQKIPIAMSIKTRIGLESSEEFVRLLQVYNQYPIKELIIHPRVQKDLYMNSPNWEVFQMAWEESKNPLCYNGDIFRIQDMNEFVERFPYVDSIMLGRGLISNPGLADAIQEGITYDKKVWKAFHDELVTEYRKVMSGDRNVLFKLKEVWFYMGQSFEGAEKLVKAMRKTNHMDEYLELTEKLFEEKELNC
ncbi:MAG: tRNA-dihydrouridine synthase family protein [Clostridium sp.]|nr:tRNA-dihydrouridine synthase family protein [Clostridium sp.]